MAPEAVPEWLFVVLLQVNPLLYPSAVEAVPERSRTESLTGDTSVMAKFERGACVACLSFWENIQGSNCGCW